MTDRPLPPEPLFTAKEAAAKLGMSVKSLMSFVFSGELRFINVGTKTRKRYRFTTYNLTSFIEKRKVRLTAPCPSFKDPRSPYYRFDFVVKGRRFFGSTKARNKKDALDAEKLLRAKARADLEAEWRTGNAPLTLDDAAGRYWQEIGQHHRDKAGTWHALGLLVEFFGKTKRLDEIDDADVAALVAWRRAHKAKGRDRPISAATVNRSAVEPLRKVFIRARTVWRYALPREPLWRSHRLGEPTEHPRELHANEAEALDAALRPDFAPWFRFASATGLRLAETLLRWESVNWEAKTISTIGKAGRPVTTPITAEVAAILEPLKGHDAEHVFTYVCRRPKKDQVKGKRYPITYAGAKSEWQAMRKRAAVKGFRFHDVRHDMATKLLRATGNLKLVSRALNHSDVKTTARYAHVLDGELAEALQGLAETRNSPKKSPNDDGAASETIDPKGGK